MGTTLTIRASDALREALSRRAAVQDKTVSEVVREILEDALMARRPLAARAGHLKGRLELPSGSDDPWRERLRERNWRS